MVDMGHLHEDDEMMTLGGFVVDNKTIYRTLQKINPSLLNKVVPLDLAF